MTATVPMAKKFVRVFDDDKRIMLCSGRIRAGGMENPFRVEGSSGRTDARKAANATRGKDSQKVDDAEWRRLFCTYF